MGKSKIPETGIYDARQLGTGRMLLLGFQHMFAMFGATILVPILTGLDVSNTLLFAGLGTLLFHLITGGKVPAFLGSSFAFLGGYATIAPMLGEHQDIPNLEMLPYACFGVACAGLVYVILAYLFKVFGAKKVMRFFPPIVTGPIIIAIGLTLSSSAIDNCTGNWWIAIVAIAIIVAANIWGKGMIKIIPILLGVIGSYVIAVIADPAVRDNLVQNVSEAEWFALPIKMEQTVFGLFASGNVDAHKLLTAAITIVPLSLATMVEHIGDVSAISSTCDRNYIEDPGLHRTLMGDGLATTLAALFGAPANTTYGENTGVLALSRIYDPRVIRIAAVLAMLFSFSPKFAAIISSMPKRHHRRRQPRALRHDLRGRRAQRRREQGRLHQVPQRSGCGPDPGPVHRHQAIPSAGTLQLGPDRPVWSGCRLHRRHRPQRRHARQGLRLRRRQAGRRVCQLHRPVSTLNHPKRRDRMVPPLFFMVLR